MKISNNLIQALGVNNKISAKKQTESSGKSTGAKKFDQIIIDKSKSTSPSTPDFAAAISAKVSNELKTGMENQKLEGIKQDIKSGNYSVNSAEVTRKMMIGLQ